MTDWTTGHTAPIQRSTLAWHRLKRLLGPRVRVPLRRAGQYVRARSLVQSDTLFLSYPKAGSTWVRNMVAIVMAGEERPVSELAIWVPPLHSVNNARFEPRLVRSHDPINTPGFGRAGRAVVLIRDPRAIAVSAFHHLDRTGMDPKSIDAVADLITSTGFDDLGSWQAHIRAVQSDGRAKRDVRVMKYEDFVADPHRELARLCEFLGLPHDEPLLQTAIEATTPARLRERMVDAGLDSAGRPTNFVRNANPDSWRSECPMSAIRSIESAAGDEMRLYGYDRVGNLE